jgi:hypothetical protein
LRVKLAAQVNETVKNGKFSGQAAKIVDSEMFLSRHKSNSQESI